MPWVEFQPPPTELIIRAPEVVDTVNRLTRRSYRDAETDDMRTAVAVGRVFVMFADLI